MSQNDGFCIRLKYRYVSENLIIKVEVVDIFVIYLYFQLLYSYLYSFNT